MSIRILPFDIQEEILKRMNDVKSLIRFRSISKAWKSHIESPKFIADHHHHHQSVSQRQRRHLIVRDKNRQNIYVSIIGDNDDDRFHGEQYRTTTLPSTLSQPNSSILLIGSSDGMLGYYRWCAGNLSIVLWNPSIRKSVAIGVPKVFHPRESLTYVGFGVCPGTSDPKLVKIVSISVDEYSDKKMMPWEVEVYTLSSGVWRSPLGTSCKLPRKSIALSWLWPKARPVVINGIIYWLAWDRESTGRLDALIISFDLTTEEFEEIYFPPDNSVKCPRSLANRRETLVLLEYCYNREAGTAVCGVWVMNHLKSFTKLYSVMKEKVPRDSFVDILEFRKNGDPIIETRYGRSVSALELYHPCSECFIDLGFRNEEYPKFLTAFYTVTSYTETLALLDYQSADSSIQE